MGRPRRAESSRPVPPQPAPGSGLGVTTLKDAPAPSGGGGPHRLQRASGEYPGREEKDQRSSRVTGIEGGHKTKDPLLYPFKRWRELTRRCKSVNCKILLQNLPRRAASPTDLSKRKGEQAGACCRGGGEAGELNQTQLTMTSWLCPHRRDLHQTAICSIPAGVGSRKTLLKQSEKPNLAPE